MVKTLPAWMELRRDQTSQRWVMTCRACGLREYWHNFWLMSRAADDHVDMHHQEENEKRAGS